VIFVAEGTEMGLARAVVRANNEEGVKEVIFYSLC
jgi:hypothetical protein